jgi:hypothetical protein
MEQREIWEIAQEIREDWKNVYFGAGPYLRAMGSIRFIDDMYGCDTARSVVLYFLSNAKTWRGEVARRVKKELKSML